jgi:pimeloyl-ACP methyl ester carboxylesterase
MSHPPTSPSPTDLHDDQVVALLRTGAHASLLSAYFGDVEYRELSQLARIAATRRKPRGPLVFVLPGMMGSRIGSGRGAASSLLWLHPAAVAGGGLMQLALPGPRSMRALGVMLPGYLKLRLSLEIAGFRPLFYPFDWRADLQRLARTFMQAVTKTGASKAHIVAHSMGGLVARAALAYDDDRRIGRLIQLGAPNAGSFAPVQALRAVYPTVRKIASLDQKNSAEALASEVFRTLPGLYQLLPSQLDPGELDLFDARSWPDDNMRPDAKILARAKKVRASMPLADKRCAVIAGVRQETITAVSIRNGVFEYEIRRDGDGTVPLSRALWNGARAWFAEENHGGLTSNSTVLAAVADILRTGSTERLGDVRPAPGEPVRRVNDHELRAAATGKMHWDKLSLDSRRRILEPVISPEFAVSST